MGLAIVFELIGTISTKASSGVTKMIPSITMFFSYVMCALCLALALDISAAASLDLGVAYATWSGIGTVAAAVAGICLYEETLSNVQVVGIVLTLVGVTLVNISPKIPFIYSQGDDRVVNGSEAVVPSQSQYGSMGNTSVDAWLKENEVLVVSV